MDKPKTLQEQLNKVATAIESIFGYYDVNGVYHKANECADLAAEVRAMAEQAKEVQERAAD